MKHFTKEEQKKYTESIRKVFTLPEEYLRRADEKLPSDSKELKKDYLKLRSENTLLGERCNQLLTDKGKLTDRVQELEALIEKMKVCQNCNNWNWKHNKCEKKLKGDCFKQSKWILRR